VSPILVRPVREQLEHDRIIRLLPGRYRRRFEVAINPGAEQNAGVGTGPTTVFPDAVLYSTERGRRVQGVVEVETVESVNHLEAMAQWASFGRLRVPFHLYVPVASLDVARRLSSVYQAVVAEIWTYDNVGDQVRFTLVQKAAETGRGRPATPAAPKASKTAAAKPTKAVKVTKVAKPAAKAVRPPRPASRTSRSAAPAPRKAVPARKPARAVARPPARRIAKAPTRKATSGQKRK
jgi:hypothetical protein